MGYLPIVKLLINAAVNVTITDSSGFNALHYGESKI